MSRDSSNALVVVPDGRHRLDALVTVRRGPYRERKSGAGLHDTRPNRQRSRGDGKRAAIRESRAC
jgi:hypothetical protein